MVPNTSEIIECPLVEIASYLDRELSSAEDAAFETHLRGCEVCRTELKHQREFLFALNASLESERDIPLPKNFTRTIVTNAESRVSGLRRPRERFTAIFICAALFFFALFALGSEAGTVWSAFASIAEKVLAVGSYGFRLVFSISYSVAVVIRSLFSHVSGSWFLAPAFLILICVAVFAFSRSLARNSRTQEN